MKITGDDELGKAQLDNFINPKRAYPVIATTSELMTTGVDAKTCKLVVLDQNIQSMTKFKQIIGRGTRIDDRYNKLWFTILDFKKATELFADPSFDGVPEKVMVTTAEDVIDLDDSTFDDELASAQEEQAEAEAALDDNNGNEVKEPQATYDVNNGLGDGPIEDEEGKHCVKYRVSGVTVTKIAERVQYYDTDGKLVTESFKDYTRNTIKKQFASLNDFIKTWQCSERKQAIINELEAEGVIWQALEEDVSRDLDPFDLICHVAFDQPALTRRERAENVKKRNYFTKYSAAAQNVLNALLDKYADVGVTEIESINVLKVKPLDQLGTPLEIVKNAFGSKKEYEQAITELEAALYSDEQASA